MDREPDPCALPGVAPGAVGPLGRRREPTPLLGPVPELPAASTARIPALFVGHGSPMNAIEDNRWSRAFKALGEELSRPRAILAISAHWYVRGTFVTTNEHPPTLHDFGGFPRELFEVEYPAPGAPDLAERVRTLLGAEVVSPSLQWGLDHGTWTVLRYLRPAADVPVVQLSLDEGLAPERHLALAQGLAPLRDEGVLVLGSGNAVHNLRDAFDRMRSGDASIPEWATDFDTDTARACEQHDGAFLARAVETSAGRRAHPTLDHYLPLLYVVGVAGMNDPVRFPVEGFDASLSMRAVRFG